MTHGKEGRGDAIQPWSGIVWILTIYVALMIVGDVTDYLIGLAVEHVWPEASLPIFLGLYFLFLWLAWVAAVKLTEPRKTADANGAASD